MEIILTLIHAPIHFFDKFTLLSPNLSIIMCLALIQYFFFKFEMCEWEDILLFIDILLEFISEFMLIIFELLD